MTWTKEAIDHTIRRWIEKSKAPGLVVMNPKEWLDFLSSWDSGFFDEFRDSFLNDLKRKTSILVATNPAGRAILFAVGLAEDLRLQDNEGVNDFSPGSRQLLFFLEALGLEVDYEGFDWMHIFPRPVMEDIPF